MKTFPAIFQTCAIARYAIFLLILRSDQRQNTSDSLVTEFFKALHKNSNTKLIYKDFFTIQFIALQQQNHK
ncbi:hypothetical protein FORC37_3018 [Vibrio vulnificus]|nr:hypothetical protein FORC37_3018 [Vibrio vulnificus]